MSHVLFPDTVTEDYGKSNSKEYMRFSGVSLSNWTSLGVRARQGTVECILLYARYRCHLKNSEFYIYVTVLSRALKEQVAVLLDMF